MQPSAGVKGPAGSCASQGSRKCKGPEQAVSGTARRLVRLQQSELMEIFLFFSFQESEAFCFYNKFRFWSKHDRKLCRNLKV